MMLLLNFFSDKCEILIVTKARMHVNLIISANNMNATGLNMSDQKHDNLEMYVFNNFGLILAYIEASRLFSRLPFSCTFRTQLIYTQLESFVSDLVVDSYPSQN